MNERIKELAKQSGAVFVSASMDYFGEVHPPGILTNEIDVEKFAELIIKECVKEAMEEFISEEDIASDYDPLIREYLKGNNQGVVDVVVRIRNHFGVTE